MKNFFLAFSLTFLSAALLQLFLPWWSVAIASFAAAYFVRQKPLLAFIAAFSSVFILWVAYSFVLSAANENLLANRVTELLSAITQGSLALLYVLTGFVGGLAAAMAALTASLMRRISL
jgi:hypothetical protein